MAQIYLKTKCLFKPMCRWVQIGHQKPKTEQAERLRALVLKFLKLRIEKPKDMPSNA